MRTELACESNTPYLSRFSSGEAFILWKIGLFIYIEETCISPGTIPSMLEA
jgi:hypothetical protein